MNEEQRKNVCRLIAGLVVTDDDLSPPEEAFLDKLLAKFGIPPDQRETIFPIVDSSEAAAAIRALPPDAQAATLTLLIEATVADGVVAPEERAYLDVVAAELGLTAAELEKKIAAKLAER